MLVCNTPHAQHLIITQLISVTKLYCPPPQGVIRVRDELDFETSENLTLTARATDMITSHFVEVYVDIQVTDVNDNLPKFHHQHFSPKISEASSPGTSVLKILTKDKDTAPNAGVSYSLQPLYNHTSPSLFFINPNTGLITLNSILDREVQDSHRFLVIATDTGKPKLTSTAVVDVTG